MPVAAIPIVAVRYAIVAINGAIIGGSIAAWCEDHPGPGCVNKFSFQLADFNIT